MNSHSRLTCPPCRPCTSSHTRHTGQSPCAYPKRERDTENRERGRLRWWNEAEGQQGPSMTYYPITNSLLTESRSSFVSSAALHHSYSRRLVHFLNKLPAIHGKKKKVQTEWLTLLSSLSSACIQIGLLSSVKGGWQKKTTYECYLIITISGRESVAETKTGQKNIPSKTHDFY